MARRTRVAGKEAPVSVALSTPLKAAFQAEAKRRGLGLSTTIRTLAVERTNELSEQRQRERAMRWQTERMRTLADRIEAGEIGEASRADIDALFEDLAAPRKAAATR